MDALSIRELFAEFGPVDVRRMFGGVGIFVDGRMIALVSRTVIYLKADAETIPDFEREGLAPFSYATRNGERKLTSYWRMPTGFTMTLRKWRAGRAARTQLRSGPPPGETSRAAPNQRTANQSADRVTPIPADATKYLHLHLAPV